jgi:hypothetical protein
MKGERNGTKQKAAKPMPFPFLRLIGIANKKHMRVISKNGSREISSDGSSIDRFLSSQIQH